MFSMKNITESTSEKLVQMVHRSAKRAAIPLLMGNVFCYVLLADTLDRRILVAWLAITSITVLFKLYVIGWLVKNQHMHYENKLRLLAFLTFFGGLSISSILYFFPLLDAFERAILTALLLSLSSGAVILNSGYRPLFLSYTAPIFGSLAIWWLVNPGNLIDGSLSVFIGFMIFVLVVTLLVMAQETFDAFASSVHANERQLILTDELSSALKHAEISQQRAEASNDSKSRFLSAASHDLRQPVHVLTLYGAVLARANVDAKTQSVIRDMNMAVDSLSSQLETLLDLSKLESGVIEPNKISVDLRTLIATLEPDFCELASTKGLQFESKVVKPVHVWTDPIMLSQVLRNLCGNAIKYTESGGVTLVVDDSDANSVTLSVVDTGIGISKEKCEHIFEEFYQVSNPGRDKSMGLGLGLSIVERLINSLEHNITLQSELNEGTTISLRMERPELEGGANPTPNCQPNKEIASIPAGSWIHVVDDDATVTKSMKALLEKHGCQVTISHSTRSTQTFLSKELASLYLVDFRLQGDDTGINVIDAIRSRDSNLPIILITGESTINANLSEQYQDILVLNKPINEASLLDAIHFMLVGMDSKYTDAYKLDSISEPANV